MILFFRTPSQSVIATEFDHQPSHDEIEKLCWLYGEATPETNQKLDGCFVGPRREMITPWSTNAVEITQNMSLNGILRIEEYFPVESEDAEQDRKSTTSELQSRQYLVCRLLLEKKKIQSPQSLDTSWLN